MPKLPAGAKVLNAVHPNIGTRVAYRKKIMRLVDAMSRDYERAIERAYRTNPPKMAEDARPESTYRGFRRNVARALPARELEDILRDMNRKWMARFNEASNPLALFFVQSVRNQSERTLQHILREGGWTVKFTMTPELRDIMRAEIAQNVSLIKSIQSQYHTEVEGMVMRSVTEGRNLHGLSVDLRRRYGITERRAAFIALDQSNKATGAIQRERQTKAGITTGIWLHSGGGREPRPTHVANNGKPFDIATGWFDPDPRVRRKILPGALPRCRCSWRPIIRGFS